MFLFELPLELNIIIDKYHRRNLFLKKIKWFEKNLKMPKRLFAGDTTYETFSVRVGYLDLFAFGDSKCYYFGGRFYSYNTIGFDIPGFIDDGWLNTNPPLFNPYIWRYDSDDDGIPFYYETLGVDF